jgi:hemerythrin superfamily protein
VAVTLGGVQTARLVLTVQLELGPDICCTRRTNHRQGKDMAKKTKKTRAPRATGMNGRGRGKSGSAADAIALLKADHREVEGWFEQFEKTRSEERKKELAEKICKALQVHAAIEEEIFYPAFLEATQEEDIHHEAEVEHDGAKKLIAQIEGSGPEEEYYDARVKVLAEMIKHHVNEEEKRDGMFAKARQSEMDLKGLGQQLAARKAELMSGSGPKPRGGMLSRLLSASA